MMVGLMVLMVMVVVVVVVGRVLGVTQADPDDGRRWAWAGAQQLIQSVQVVQTSDLTNSQSPSTSTVITPPPSPLSQQLSGFFSIENPWHFLPGSWLQVYSFILRVTRKPERPALPDINNWNLSNFTGMKCRFNFYFLKFLICGEKLDNWIIGNIWSLTLNPPEIF